MIGLDRQAHWENVYTTKSEKEVSWFEESPTISFDLIRSTRVNLDAPVIDIGGGASRLVDALIDNGFEAVTVLDLSKEALAAAKARLGTRGASVRWIVGDITSWEPSETYEVWHDRAAFHFLTEPKDRAAYAKRVASAVRPGGHVIIGTFAPDGPERCSGLPVVRHDAASLGEILSGTFELMESRPYAHQTPMGATQRFQFSRFPPLQVISASWAEAIRAVAAAHPAAPGHLLPWALCDDDGCQTGRKPASKRGM